MGTVFQATFACAMQIGKEIIATSQQQKVSFALKIANFLQAMVICINGVQISEFFLFVKIYLITINSYGELGIGNTINALLPIVHSIKNVTHMTTTTARSIIRTKNGLVYGTGQSMWLLITSNFAIRFK